MKIYHYTSIETLALILKNRTLRFNNVAKVNDPEEAVTNDFDYLKPYCFISCWTKKEEESIPFWSMYGNRGKGIRIETDSKYIHYRHLYENDKSIFCILKNIYHRKNDEYYGSLWQNATSVNPYFETKYSDEKRTFEVDLSTKTVQHWMYDYDAAFNTKKRCWSFEEEVRFIILGCRSKNKQLKEVHQIRSIMLQKRKFAKDFVDLELEQDFFDNLKILLGPLTGESEEVLVNSLINQYDKNNHIEVTKSKIRMNSIK